jgi:hypothetical protein
MKKIFSLLIVLIAVATSAIAQERKVQNRPYIDLRPLHFGISLGLNMQDVEFQNVGPQTITLQEGGEKATYVLCDADMRNPGFSVGVWADVRLHQHLALRVSPTMHFGSKHLVFRDMMNLSESGRPREFTQDMKNTYISVPVDLKFSAERFNNYRPYIVGGVNPMINLTAKSQDYIQLKRYDTMVELGLGCDFYLPFFKLIPELKFSFSLMDALDKGHAEELTDANARIYTNSVTAGHAKMVTLTFYFE